MRVRSAMAGAAAGILLALTGAVFVPTPASAATSYIGVNGYETRCRYVYKVCFYFSTWTSAYYAANASDSTLAGNTYRTGTGSGSGAAVRNNSRKIHCDWLVVNYCQSFVSPGYGGNDDFLSFEQKGELVQTWNNNASVKLS